MIYVKFNVWIDKRFGNLFLSQIANKYGIDIKQAESYFGWNLNEIAKFDKAY